MEAKIKVPQWGLLYEENDVHLVRAFFIFLTSTGSSHSLHKIDWNSNIEHYSRRKYMEVSRRVCPVEESMEKLNKTSIKHIVQWLLYKVRKVYFLHISILKA